MVAFPVNRTLTFFSRCINIGVAVNMPYRLFAVYSALEPTMPDPVFQQAYETVRRSCSDEAWMALTPREITDLIYQEIRRIDTLAAQARAAAGTKPKAPE
jgi:hypothetical protein